MSLELQCPVPQFDFDHINMGHGSGGILTHKLLKSGVFDVLKNPLLDQQHDGAILELKGKIAISTDSYVVSPIFFPGGNIGDLAINGTVNDLAMCGASARYLTLSFILEEGLAMTEFKDVLMSIRQAADQSGVQIVTGDTKVVQKGKGDKIFINTTGVGELHPTADIRHQRVEHGDVILLSGPIAAHGVAIMSLREGLEFETTVCSDTQSLKAPVLALLDSLGQDVHFLRDATRGGLASVLNELSEITVKGIHIHQKDLAIAEEVSGACEMLGLDPLYVANEGVFVAVVKAHRAEEALKVLQSFEACHSASIIGEIIADHPGKVVMKSKIGGSRVVNFLQGEQLPRIC
ncbi:MAG: hydrogenase expression/formation protein HypE [Saprospiraceae bacterium]|nr:hydrogenase expression/formation protein HypE [Saprospiraceae bacterium]